MLGFVRFSAPTDIDRGSKRKGQRLTAGLFLSAPVHPWSRALHKPNRSIQ